MGELQRLAVAWVAVILRMNDLESGIEDVPVYERLEDLALDLLVVRK